MSGWYEVSKSSNGQFRFVLKAANAETILTSELYSTRAGADGGIASVQANSPLDERYEKKIDQGRPPVLQPEGGQSPDHRQQRVVFIGWRV